MQAALRRVNVDHLRHRYFQSLSGGEKQRVLIARALTQQASYLVLDKPTNHLDICYQLDILALVKGLGVTTIAALHDLNLAAAFCEHLYLLHQGKLLATGPPVEVLTPTLIQKSYGVEVVVSRHPVHDHLHLAFVYQNGHEQ